MIRPVIERGQIESNYYSTSSDSRSESGGAAILRLSKLNELEYERIRKKEAKALGLRVSVLDKQVALAKGVTTNKQSKGRSIELFEPEQWPDPVSGSEVLTEAANHILRHMMISEANAYACVLWAAHTFMFEDFDHSPRLCITAHTEESGKTVLMTHMVGNLTNKPQTVELMKPAPFFRLAEEFKPTFLIDECDVFVREDIDLLAALNSGWEPHGGVIRCVGEDYEPRKFSTFTPTAMAGINLLKKLPATTVSRSIVISLERAAEGEINTDDIFNRKQHQASIQETGRKIARFIHDNRLKIANHNPSLPEGVRNRLADKWTPLFRIAEVAGGEWPHNAKKALYGQIDLSEPSKALELLQDVQNVMPSEGHIFTETLIDRICNLDDSPWSEYNFEEWDAEKKKIGSRQVSNLLKKYGLKPTTVKINGVPKKGYKSSELENAFRRYIPISLPPLELDVTPLLSGGDTVLSDSIAVTSNNQVTDRNLLKPFKNKEGNGVTDKTAVYPEKECQKTIIL